MGHLINPIAFRLGINKSWESTWFVKNIYYAEFLHNILNLRNFVYRFFLGKNVINSGIFLSEIFFMKFFKNYIINIYLYHLDLEKASYKFINKLYTNYYKKEYTKNLKIILPPNFWFLHNADLYAFIFVFYHIFFNNTNKWRAEASKNKLNFKIDRGIMDLINNFNSVILRKVRGKKDFFDYIDTYLKYLKNKSKIKICLLEWVKFREEMQRLKIIFKRKFRYNYYKHNLILSKFQNLLIYTKELKKWRNKYKIKGKVFFNLIYSYIVHDYNTYLELKKKIKFNKKYKKSKFKFLLKSNINKIREFTYKQSFWNRKLRTPLLDRDLLLESSDNIINNYFLNIFLYLGKKVKFAKFRNFVNFNTKWGYIIKFLKYLNILEFKSWFRSNIFFLYLTSSLYVNLKAIKSRKKFFVRALIYRFIYIWLGKIFFFRIFKYISNILNPIFIDLIHLQKIKINYFFISVNDVSARLIAMYISLKLKKKHNLQHIINPVKKELWRLSRIGRKITKTNKVLLKIIRRKRKKNFIKILQFIFLSYSKNFYNKIKKNNSMITIDFFIFKLFILKSDKHSLLIDKYLKIHIFFDFFYGKLQNNFNINFLRSNNKKKVNWSNKKNIFLYFFTKLNYLSYSNIKKFRIIKIDYLLIFTNIIKSYITFNFLQNIWDVVNKFNKRNSRTDVGQYKKSNLIAYKMSFKGRFSRKQKASSIWYAHGRASLNRLDLKIDYAFIKIPLKNSLVSIKIWLFRNTKYIKFKYVLNF